MNENDGCVLISVVSHYMETFVLDVGILLDTMISLSWIQPLFCHGFLGIANYKYHFKVY